MRQNRQCLVKLWKCQKAVSILLNEAKALLQLFCLQPIIFDWRQNSFSGAFASWDEIKIHYFTRADQDWIGLMIFRNFADQDWIGFSFIGQDCTKTKKFHRTLISDVNYITSFKSLQKFFLWLCWRQIPEMFENPDPDPEIWKSWSWSGNLNKTVLLIRFGLLKMCWIQPDSSPESGPVHLCCYNT